MTIDFSQPLALYGGSFDPVHLGHLEVVRAIRKAMSVHAFTANPCNNVNADQIVTDRK